MCGSETTHSLKLKNGRDLLIDVIDKNKKFFGHPTTSAPHPDWFYERLWLISRTRVSLNHQNYVRSELEALLETLEGLLEQGWYYTDPANTFRRVTAHLMWFFTIWYEPLVLSNQLELITRSGESKWIKQVNQVTCYPGMNLEWLAIDYKPLLFCICIIWSHYTRFLVTFGDFD